MIVSHIVLENWRNFTHVEVPLQQRVFIAGPNGAGKSNLLDAFRFLRELTSAGGGLEKAVADRGGVSRIRCLAARRYPAIVLDFRLGQAGNPGEWRYRVSIVQDNQRQPRIKEEVVEHKGEEILRRPDQDDEKDAERLRQTHLEAVSTNKPFREIYRFFDSVRYLHVLPPLVRQPERFTGRDLTGETFGSDFLEQIARSPPKVRQSRLRRIEHALRIAVPLLRELKLEKDETGIPHLEGRDKHWRPNAGWQREDQFSDGTLRLIALLWSAMDGTGPLMIEEPELNLHPTVIKFLPQMLHQTTRRSKRQVIVSTHSPEFLLDKGIASDETLLLRPDSNGTRVQVAAADPEVRLLLEGGASMGDAVLPRTAPGGEEQLALMFGD